MSQGNPFGTRHIVLAVTVAALATAGGYWIGRRGGEYGPSAAAPVGTAATPAAAKKERKPLYYRNPMGLPDTSPTPKKDSMGMDYVPVYPDEQSGQNEQDGQSEAPKNQIRISTAKVQKLGVKTEVAGLRSLDRVVRASGRIDAGEVFGEFRQDLVGRSFLARPCGGEHRLGFPLLRTAGRLLQGNVHFQHQSPGADPTAGLHRHDPQKKIRVAVAIGQVAILLRRAYACLFAEQLRVVRAQTLGQAGIIQFGRRRQGTQGLRIG